MTNSKWYGGYLQSGYLGTEDPWYVENAKITAISTRKAHQIRGTLQLQVNGGWMLQKGGINPEVEPEILELESDEVINKVKIHSDKIGKRNRIPYINFMEFFTNKGRSIQFGAIDYNYRIGPQSHIEISSGTELVGVGIKGSLIRQSPQNLRKLLLPLLVHVSAPRP